MNSNTAIRAVNISKQYRLGEVGTGTLSHDLNRYWAKLRGKEDPYLKIGDANDRTQKGESDYVWSLRDINFEIKKGDAVGIIGRNGAGKSTLLKLLSRVTQPTTGYFELQGRIASLLEVGTGFNPEMTGRENIYLNGAILGMRRSEIKRKFDEIVDFAGVERYIDTPVKRYSSGMYVRLAFAVAAHLDSEILLVDEVLSVGDAEFQKKCLGKMGDVSKGEGRTVLFVSHNMAAVNKLCTKGLFLQNGLIREQGLIDNIINLYLKENFNDTSEYDINYKKNNSLYFEKVKLLNSQNLNTQNFNINEDLILDIHIKNPGDIENANLFITINNQEHVRIFSAETRITINKLNYQLKIRSNFLSKGNYNVTAFLHIPQIMRYDEVNEVCFFEINDLDSQFIIHGGYNHGVVFGNYKWIN